VVLKVVGAGVGRTGTLSLKLALEQLLGGRCYHMLEVFEHPDHVPLWNEATAGSLEDWDAIFGDYVAAVDWPVASFWPETSAAYPDALVVLSVRDPKEWFESASSTIFAIPWDDTVPMLAMAGAVIKSRFTPDYLDETAAIAAFERHNAAVRAAVPPSRLLEWRPADGWAPICERLDLPVPDAPFPHANTRDEMRTMLGLDG
jgi:Sulfotransferase domain